jgi:hypothetical protein
MKQSRTAPPSAKKPARAPLGRAPEPPTSDEAPALSPAAEPFHDGAASGPKPRAPSEPLPSTADPGLIFAEPDGPEAWLIATRACLLDLLAAAREGARRPRKRVLSRAEIRRQAREAYAAGSSLLDEAVEALRVAAPFMKPR